MLLYHYTSLETLFAIIDGINNEDPHNVYFTLRATHASFLNDLYEGRILLQALKKLGIEENKLSILLSIQGYPFVVSLSELDDDLNMWRCYANQGKGVSIGLDKSLLKESIQTNSAKLDKCNYVTTGELVDILKKKNIESVLQSNNILELDRILADMLIYKDKSFHAEEEWRIHDFNIESKFRIGNNHVIPYREFRIPVSAIQSITLGPQCSFDKNQFSIYRMLKTKCIPLYENVKIKKSQVPLI